MNKYISTFEIGESEYKLKDSEARTEISGKSSLLIVDTIPPENGVYAIYSDGSLKTAAEADTDALGVVVITNDCCFIIDKNNNTNAAWDSNYSTNGIIAGCFATDDTNTAKTNYTGVSNTNAIAAVASGGEAAKYCRSCSKTIAGKTVYGYLGACGEWLTAYDNKSTVDSIMSTIGGTAISSSYYWTSTLYLGYSRYAWYLNLYNGYVDSSNKGNGSRLVRPFYPITKQELEKTITTPVQTVTIEQSTGSSTTDVMSLNAVSSHILDTNVHVTAAEKEYWNSKVNPPSYSAPTAKQLTYTGEAQDLLNPGSSTSGSIQYSTDETNWSTTIPQATNAGTYTVYWKFAGSEIVYVDSTTINVTIAKANPTYTAPTAKSGLVYNTSAQELLNAGTTSDGTILYSEDNENWSSSVPSKTNAGDYVVYWKLDGGTNYESVAGSSFDISIAKAAPTYTAPTAKTLTYNGNAQDLINVGMTNDGTFKYGFAPEQYIDPITNGHEYVDLGLPSSTLWATMNVGANTETDYGNWYMYGKGSSTYNSSDSVYTGTEDPLATSADTASQVWGGSWYTPTKAQLEELIANTTYTYTTINGVNGGKFTASNGNSIFIPTAGYWNLGSHVREGSDGTVWSSSPYDGNYIFLLYFYNGGTSVTYDINRNDIGRRNRGHSVRGVIDNVLPQGTNADTYTVYWKLEGDENHNDVTGAVEVTISKADRTISFSNDNGYEYVDLGTSDGTLWATMNVGANSVTDYGNYYMYGKGATTYNRSDSTYTGMEDPLDVSLDTAKLVMGGNWHTPTFLQLNAMKNATTFEWTTIDGVAGGKYTAKNGSGNYIFIPGSGRFEGSNSAVRLGSSGYIWSSTPYNNNYAYYLDLYDSSTWTNNVQRWYGMPVRGVLESSVKTELYVGSTNTVEVFTEGSPTITVTSSNTKVATVSNMTITAVSGGTTTITVTTSEDTNYNSTSVSYTLKVKYPNGVYAAYSDGSLKTLANADSSALGVAVVSSNCLFIIGKTDLANDAWDSQYSTNGVISGCTAVDSNQLRDYEGVSNTDAIVSVAYGGEAAKSCRQCSMTIDGVTKYGYLGACGLWYAAYQNKTYVDAMMSTIGGTAIKTGYYWSSTLRLNANFKAWTMDWSSGATGNYNKYDLNFYIRPFYPLD